MPDYILRVKVDPTDAKRGSAEVVTSLGKIEGQAKQTSGAVGGLDGTFRTLRASALALGAFSFFKKAISEAEQSRVAFAQLEAGIRSTGGASGWTAAQLAKQAGELQRLTGRSDEAIMSAQGVLLTFTRIGRDAFPQATKAVLNLAARMGGDLRGAALQVGKALNDPEKGLQALTRAGVQFSDQQEAMIEKMVAAGDVAGAQAVILKELEVQFGGSAEAGRNSLEVLGNSWSDLLEKVGESSGGIKRGIEGTAKALDFLSDHWDALEAAVLSSAATIVGGVGRMSASIVLGLAKVVEAIAKVAGAAGLDSLSKSVAAAGANIRAASKSTLEFFELLEEGLRIQADEAIDRQAAAMGNLGEEIGGTGGPVEGMRDLNSELRDLDTWDPNKVAAAVKKATDGLRTAANALDDDMVDSLQSRFDAMLAAQAEATMDALKERNRAEEEAAAESRRRAEEMAAYVREPMAQAWQSTKDIALDTLTALATGQKVQWEQLAKDWLAMWFRAMAEWLVRWIATQQAAKAAQAGSGGMGGGGGGGGIPGMGGGGMGGAWGAMSSGAGGGATSAVGMAWWAAAFVAVVAILKNQSKSSGRVEADTTLQFGGEGGISVNTDLSRYNSKEIKERFKQQIKAIEEMIKAIGELIGGLGGTIDKMAAKTSTLTVGREGQGKNTNWFVKYAGDLVKHFGQDSQAAFDFAMVQAIKQTPTIGLSPEVAAAIKGSTAETMAQLQGEINAALSVVRARLGDMGAQVFDLVREWSQEIAAAAEVGLAVDGLIEARDRELAALRNNLLGIDTSAADALAALASFQRGIEEVAGSMAAVAQHNLAAAQASLDALLASGPRSETVQHPVGGGSSTRTQSQADFEAEIAALRAQIDRYVAELGKIPQALSDTEINMGIFNALYQYVQGSRKYEEDRIKYAKLKVEIEFATIKAQLIALGKWEEFAELFTDAYNTASGEAGKPRRGRGGGGGRRQQVKDDQALLEDILEGAKRSRMSDFGRAMAEANARWEEARKLAHGNAEALKDVNRERRLELRAIRERERADIRSETIGLGGSGFMPTAEIDAVRASAEALRVRLVELGKTGVDVTADLKLLADAEKYRLDQIGMGLIDRLFGYLQGNEAFEAQRQAFEHKKIDLEFKIIEAQLKALGMWDEATQNLFNAARDAAHAIVAGADKVAAAFQLPPDYAVRGPYGSDWEEIVRQQQEHARRLADVNRALREFKESLKLDESVSPLTPLQKLQEAERQYRATLGAAEGGNLDAVSKVPDALRAFLDQAKSFYGFGGAYLAIFNEGQAALDRLISRTSSPGAWEAANRVSVQSYPGPTSDEQAAQSANQLQAIERVQGAVEETGIYQREQTEILRQIASQGVSAPASSNSVSGPFTRVA